MGENEFAGALKIRVGPVQGQFQGTVTLSDLVPLTSYRLKMNGKGAAGFVDGEGAIELQESDGGTLLHYDVDAKVGGRIAGVGQRLLDSSAKVLTRQALEGLERQLAARAGAGSETGGEGGAAPGPSAEPPSQAAFAAKMARGVLADLIPPERRPLAITVALVVYTAVVVLLTRACSG